MRFAKLVLTFASFGVLMEMREQTSSVGLRMAMAGLAFAVAASAWYLRPLRRAN